MFGAGVNKTFGKSFAVNKTLIRSASVLAIGLVLALTMGALSALVFASITHRPDLLAALNDTSSQPVNGIDPITVEENTTELTNEEAAVFTHLSTSETIRANSTYVDHPFADGNPNAILFVARVSEPGRVSDDFHNTGVWYDANRSKWAVFNQDREPMFSNTAFDVSVFEEPGGDVFVHRATPANTVENGTYVDSLLTNQTPDAVLSITPNWNPGGGAGIYNNHPVSVSYDAEEAKWVIFNQDLGSMPEGAAFNVAVS